MPFVLFSIVSISFPWLLACPSPSRAHAWRLRDRAGRGQADAGDWEELVHTLAGRARDLAYQSQADAGQCQGRDADHGQVRTNASRCACGHVHGPSGAPGKCYQSDYRLYLPQALCCPRIPWPWPRVPSSMKNWPSSCSSRSSTEPLAAEDWPSDWVVAGAFLRNREPPPGHPARLTNLLLTPSPPSTPL